VVGVDYRQQRPAFKVETDLRDGIQTAFAVSPGANVMKLFTAEIYCHSTEIPLFCVIK
jgi:hypothetical protein